MHGGRRQAARSNGDKHSDSNTLSHSHSDGHAFGDNTGVENANADVFTRTVCHFLTNTFSDGNVDFPGDGDTHGKKHATGRNRGDHLSTGHSAPAFANCLSRTSRQPAVCWSDGAVGRPWFC